MIQNSAFYFQKIMSAYVLYKMKIIENSYNSTDFTNN